MKSKKTKIIITGLVVILGVIAFFLFSGSGKINVEVQTVPVAKGKVVTEVTATGTVEPIIQVEVGTQVSGVVEKIYVDYNSEVKEGQLIAELDKVSLKASLSDAQASYNNAINEKSYREQIYNRQKELYENQVISRSDYDEAVYNYTNAKNTVTQRLSDLERAKANLGYANIYSPIDGVVLSRDVDEGQTVAASYSTPTLFTIAKDLKEMQVEADVDEADIGEVKEGQRVTFTVDAYQGVLFNGEVTQVRLNPTTASNVVTYTVVIKADNPDLKLKPGLTATISIYTLELSDVLTLEAKAVNFRPDPAVLGTYAEQQGKEPMQRPEPGTKGPSAPDEDAVVVWVAENGNIRPVTVTLGASDGVQVQVLDGLQEGDSVVYHIEVLQKGSGTSSSAEDSSSPFMPKPPGKRK